MKKLLAVIMTLCLLLSLASLTACGKKAEPKPTPDKPGQAEENTEKTDEKIDWTTYMGNGELVATIFPTYAPEALQVIRDQWMGVMEEHGFNPQYASAELDMTQFVPLIENYMTMGAALLCISPMDPTGLEDIITKAREDGIIVTILSAQPEYEVDGGLTTDNYATGTVTAQMMLDFIDKTWPDAEDKSIPVAVAIQTNLQEYIARTQGVIETIEASDKAYISYRQEVTNNTAEAGFNFAEAALTADNSLRCFIMSDADQLTGINNYIMSLPDMPLGEVCVVATGNLQPEVQSLIESSAENGAVVRGLTAYGGETPGITLAEVALKLLSGAEEGPCWAYDEIYTVNSFGFEYQG